MDSPYLLGYDWCTYHSQLYKGCCRTRIRSFQAGAISMQQERTWHAIQRPVLSAHGLSAGLRVEWKRTRRSALRHSRPQCKLLPSRACLKADGLLVARARGHKERASNLWMARAAAEPRKASHVHPFIIVILFLRALNIDIAILLLHQIIFWHILIHIQIPTNSVPTQLAC